MSQAEVGGPLKVVFPAEARETYADDQWMRGIIEVQIHCLCLSGQRHPTTMEQGRAGRDTIAPRCLAYKYQGQPAIGEPFVEELDSGKFRLT